MKKLLPHLLLALLVVGCVFGDAIQIEVNGEIETIDKVNFINVGNSSIFIFIYFKITLLTTKLITAYLN